MIEEKGGNKEIQIFWVDIDSKSNVVLNKGNQTNHKITRKQPLKNECMENRSNLKRMHLQKEIQIRDFHPLLQSN